MTDFILRPAGEKDIEQIINIWKASFGDGEAFILSLVNDCSLLRSAVCAELEGQGRSFMFAFDGLSLNGKKAAYIYALCTEPAYRGRGLGRAVTAYTAEMAAERGAEIVFLKPAGKALEKWYASTLGAVPFARTAVEKVKPSVPVIFSAEEIRPEEYLEARSESSWQLPASLISAQNCVHRHYGGGFFRCGENFVCAEKIDSGVLVREIMGPDIDAALAAVADKFGLQELYLLCEREDGSPLMCIPPFLPPDDSAFPSMPFRLD